MRSATSFAGFAALLALIPGGLPAQDIAAAGAPAQLDVRTAGERSVRITLTPITHADSAPYHPAVSAAMGAAPVLSLRSLTAPVRRQIGALDVEVRPDPLAVTVAARDGTVLQELVFETDGTLTFRLDDEPVLGMGGGGPRPEPGTPWRQQPVQFDRRGALDTMEPRWQAGMYGSRNPVAMLFGTSGWGLFVTLPWVHVDLRDGRRGVFLPWYPEGVNGGRQSQRNQHEQFGKGTPPIDRVVRGLFDVFVFDAREPQMAMRDFSRITGPAVLPPKWALGYMQSHRTIEDEAQLVGIVDTFRAKRIPLDAVIYLGTGFAPRGWNTRQPSFELNPDVFRRDPREVLSDFNARDVKVVVHMVPYDRDRLPTLQGTIPPRADEIVDASHILDYWQRHIGLVETGVDAFWPDEGDWFDLFERITRHRMYYQGMLWTKPDARPWSLQRNGYPGIAQWGGWVWSGDTDSAWKTLEAQIAVGLNYSLSVGPYWGSDIGGFYPNAELTGELYARWFQFAAFCGSFRGHGRTWWTRLPWGWGLGEFGPQEVNNTNTVSTPADERRLIRATELNNPAIEPVVKRYAELRYQLMPYTYTLSWEARHAGLPLMRALWLHHADDERARRIGDQYLWGRDLLIAPVYEPGATSRDVYLPPGEWYDWWSNERVAGGRTVRRSVDLATMPIYVRAGAIIPFDPVRQYALDPVTGPTTLRVYEGADGEFTLYDDDGTTPDYLNGRATWIRMTWEDAARRLTLEPGAPVGMTNLSVRRTFDVLLAGSGTRRSITYAGQPLTIEF